MRTPGDLKFAKTHEWARDEGDSIVSIGISDHAQNSLGDITFVELPKIGAGVLQGKQFGVIDSVKAASDLYAPVSGEVVEVNSELGSGPEKVNRSPYGDGWLIRIRISNAQELGNLLSPADYERLI